MIKKDFRSAAQTAWPVTYRSVLFGSNGDWRATHAPTDATVDIFYWKNFFVMRRTVFSNTGMQTATDEVPMRPAGITEEMVDVGIDALLDCDLDYDGREEIVVSIFEAMMKARTVQ